MHTLHKFFITGGSLGYYSRFPGTLGALLGCFFFLALKDYTYRYPTISWTIWVFLIIYAFYAIHSFMSKEALWGDPSYIIIDEILAQIAILLLLPYSWKILVMGFLLFRFFDITKVIPPIKYLEKLPSPYGIMLDDLMAAIYSTLIIYLLHTFVIPLN